MKYSSVMQKGPKLGRAVTLGKILLRNKRAQVLRQVHRVNHLVIQPVWRQTLMFPQCVCIYIQVVVFFSSICTIGKNVF